MEVPLPVLFVVCGASLYVAWVGFNADPVLVRNRCERILLMVLGMAGFFGALITLTGQV